MKWQRKPLVYDLEQLPSGSWHGVDQMGVEMYVTDQTIRREYYPAPDNVLPSHVHEHEQWHDIPPSLGIVATKVYDVGLSYPEANLQAQIERAQTAAWERVCAQIEREQLARATPADWERVREVSRG